MRKLIIPIIVLALAAASCDVTSLNENEKDPTDIPPDPLFSNAQVTMGTFLQNVNVNINIFNLMSQHWTTTTYTAEPRYEVDNRTIPSNDWSLIYQNVLNDLKESRRLIEANEMMDAAVKKNKLASIKVVEVLAYSKLVDIFGNVPFSEALNPDITLPKYDDGMTIYTSLIDSLDTAIGNLDASAEGFGTADVYYNGDINKWIKFANSLKMRLGIMLADVDPGTAQSAVESASPNAFTSRDDNTMIPFQSAPPNTNPVWENLVQSGRDDFLPAEALINRMNDWDDPRREVFFTQLNGEYVGAPYGVSNDYTDYSHFSDVVTRKDRPGTIMSYSEVEFIRAEAAARNYNVSGTAATHYNNAITADMSFWGVSQTEITAYLAQTDVAYATAPGTYREKIGRQKWAALFLQGLQAWTTYRRLDAPTLEAPEQAAVDIVPTRFTYPIEEERFNQENMQEAAQAIGGNTLTTQLFWDQN